MLRPKIHIFDPQVTQALKSVKAIKKMYCSHNILSACLTSRSTGISQSSAVHITRRSIHSTVGSYNRSARVKASGSKVASAHTMNAHGVAEVKLHLFLTESLEWVCFQHHSTAALLLRKEPMVPVE